MFGYIAPDLRSLPEDRQAVYRAFYCGLCHSLNARFGQAGRLSLSNDMTFLAILLSSLFEPETAATRSRCVLHPMKSRTFLSSPMIDYAADMNVLLFYYKCEDQRRDERSLPGHAGEKAFRRRAEKVRAKYPLQSAQVEEALSAVWALEDTGSADADALCNLSGRMLGSVFVPDPEDLWARQLYAVGEGLGRFVYWMDAWEDLDGDLKKGRFNPLRQYRDRPDYEGFCRETMEMLIAEAAGHFELLPLEKDLDILRNILYSGVWQRYALRMSRLQGKEGVPHDE